MPVKRSKRIKALEEQRAAFKAKFGREPGPNDPILFDPDADEPRPLDAGKLHAEMLAAMRAAGTPPEFVYAYEKTGLIITADTAKNFSRRDREEYQAAIREYFEKVSGSGIGHA